MRGVSPISVMSRLLLVATVCCGAPFVATASAQAPATATKTTPATDVKYEVGGIAGGQSLLDDESWLGGGVGVGVSGGWYVTPRLLLQAEVLRLGHHRNTESVSWEGRALTGIVRAVYIGGEGRVRGVGGGGIGVMQYRGTYTVHPFVPPFGSPSRPNEVTRFSESHFAWDAGGGVQIRATPRLVIRPEARMTVGRPEVAHEGLLIFCRGQVTVAYQW